MLFATLTAIIDNFHGQYFINVIIICDASWYRMDALGGGPLAPFHISFVSGWGAEGSAILSSRIDGLLSAEAWTNTVLAQTTTWRTRENYPRFARHHGVHLHRKYARTGNDYRCSSPFSWKLQRLGW